MFPPITERVARHETFVIERVFRHSPKAVFAAHASNEAKDAWFKGPPDWRNLPREFDFRVGGKETSSGGPKDGWTSHMDGTYLDIVPNERIVMAFTMHIDDRLITISLATTELKAHPEGTQYKLTEQIIFVDGADHLENRIEGTQALVAQLEAYLNSQPA